MIEKFEHFEKPILEAFAAQLPGISTILLAQIESIMECEREFTGCGPISTFILKENCPVFEPDTDLSPVSYSLTDIEFLSAWHGGIGSDIERSPLTGEIAESASVTLFFMDSKIDMLDIATFGDEVWPKKEIPVSFKFLPD